MATHYDATGKDLIEQDPAGWLEFLGAKRPRDRVTMMDADISTVTAAADKVIRVADESPWLVHLELQASWDDTLPGRLLQYNAVLHARHAMPVSSVVVLLRPAANMGAVTGQLAFTPPIGPGWEFRYTLIKVWEEDRERFLTGPLGLLPLAPIADVKRDELKGVVRRLRKRLDKEVDEPTAKKLDAAMYILLGLRYEAAFIQTLLAGVKGMKDSTTYQAILEEGRVEEAQRILLRLGETKFGPPPARVRRTIAAITDPARIEALTDKILTTDKWNDLFPRAK